MKVIEFAFVVFAAVSFLGLITHYWITAKVERAGIPVKYIGYTSDWQRLYRQYLVLATKSGWPVWPYYFVQIATYGGFFGIALTLVIDPSLMQSVQRWGSKFLQWMGR
jgi:hypothetical protein